MFRQFVHSQITFGCCFVLALITIKFDVPVLRLIMNPKSLLVGCFSVSIVCALLNHLFCHFVLTLITIKSDPFMFRQSVHSQITLFCCFALLLITIKSDPFMFRKSVHFYIIFFLLLCTHIDHNQIRSPHVSIVCALSGYSLQLLCTHTDHNRI